MVRAAEVIFQEDPSNGQSQHQPAVTLPVRVWTGLTAARMAAANRTTIEAGAPADSLHCDLRRNYTGWAWIEPTYPPGVRSLTGVRIMEPKERPQGGHWAGVGCSRDLSGIVYPQRGASPLFPASRGIVPFDYVLIYAYPSQWVFRSLPLRTTPRSRADTYSSFYCNNPGSRSGDLSGWCSTNAPETCVRCDCRECSKRMPSLVILATRSF